MQKLNYGCDTERWGSFKTSSAAVPFSSGRSVEWWRKWCQLDRKKNGFSLFEAQVQKYWNQEQETSPRIRMVTPLKMEPTYVIIHMTADN